MAFSSPKRKRGEDQSIPPLQTSLVSRFPTLVPEGNLDGASSPRTYVAGRFQNLELESSIPEQRLETEHRETKRQAFCSKVEQDRQGFTTVLNNHTHSASEDLLESKPPSAASFAFESSNSTPYPNSVEGRPRSPTLDGEISDNYWHESEITGHDPDDPNDDGYGINGIGFKPTPTLAYARSQRRKQQLAEYRSREAREARQKRSERRRVGSGDLRGSSPMDDIAAKGSKVHFEDG